MKRKGQVSAFIIIGIILLIGFSIVTLMRIIHTTETKTEAEISLPKALEQNSLKIYVESCIHKASKEPIKLIGEQGGAINLTDYVWYNREKYNYLCKNEEGKGCVNKLVLRQDIEKELSSEIKKQINACIKLDEFEKQGYVIKKGKIKARTSIGLEEVNVFLDYPLTISKGADSFEANDFSSVIESPLGEAYLLAVDILNSELSGGFDKDEWMVNNGAEILIEEHKPYPDTVYKLV